MKVLLQPDALTGKAHVRALVDALNEVEGDIPRIRRWAIHLARVLTSGGRLLAIGNGGSAAQAQHLTSELVGRYRDERPPFSAIALHADTSSVTAITNDYGVNDMFARQVLAHGRTGDIVIALSTSGRSPNVLAAAEAARGAGLRVWGLTGRGPNPLSERVDETLAVDADETATVQEVHLVVVHLLCGYFDAAIGCSEAR